ncbi:hypothetical protein P175DRAFT_0474488 [Aspergillus ochraceoroseus IBT 24754]|uniref:DOC domain-containing protein n=2 Tax=Aspergillus ochraceoroseus TaxID=138278 RepID=A0A2T5M2X3_9EURO|nr:uncharacterized protein P175DRAFT_0474488 [Aspergillus ochraceoroseus IBT 24754]KKK20281.1 hypothetical protein AOCH_007103 [Aspergillus ochraceoroseus]PTU22885.1 hypothetical protein P175DRAFT_0474488 [Aspergillus ochraceoroseus IBT 24754]
MPRHLLRRHPAAPEPPSDDSPQPRANRTGLTHIPAQSQFHTPPSRAIPQLHPSSGPLDPSANPAAQAALFSLFGRGVAGRPPHRGSMIEDEDEDEDDSPLDDDDDDEDLDEDLEGLNGAETDHEPLSLHAETGNEVDFSEEDMEGMVGDEVDGGDEDEDELMQDQGDTSPSPLPGDLREISSLASWTVSTHKPGCGVAALRNPDHLQYWQSDGPQPHTLTLHFFKLVAVVKIRVYLDFGLDESYTPTKMAFLAGMGGNDLVEFATWEGEGPCGWVDVPLEGVGGQNGGWVRKRSRHRRARKSFRHAAARDNGKGKGKGKGSGRRSSATAIWVDDSLFSDSENQDGSVRRFEEGRGALGEGYDVDDDSDDDPYAGSVLKAMVIQMRVMENHQNGKDTHVRGFQVFARDDDRRRIGNAPSASADGRIRRQSVRKSLRGANDDGIDGRGEGAGDEERGKKVVGLEEPDWMGDPVIR